MSEMENALKPVLKEIAEEQEYHDYTTKVSVTSGGGAHYTSQLYNITLSAPGKDDIKLFAKVAVLGEKCRSNAAMQAFEKETMFYTKLVSQYRKYEEQYKFPPKDRLIFSKFYGASNEYMKEVLVLEDLTAKGYQPFDRLKCYDWEYASKCVGYLAKLHALSVRYKKDFPEEFEDMSQKLAVTFPLEDMKVFINKAIDSGLEATADESKETLEKFITDNMTDEKFNAFFDSPRKVGFNHGDFKPNNIMHRTNDDGNLEIVALDYQAPHKGNPVEDLIFFLIIGSDEEFRAKYLFQYFDYYYEEFSRVLRMLEIDPDEVYTKEQFDADVKEILPFGIMLALLVLPFVTVDEEETPQLEDGIDYDTFTIKPSTVFQKRFGALVKDFVKLGIL